VSKVTILLSYLIILRVILYCIHHVVFLDDQTWGEDWFLKEINFGNLNIFFILMKIKNIAFWSLSQGVQ